MDTFIAGTIVVLAVFYLIRRLIRTSKGSKGCTCGSGPCGSASDCSDPGVMKK